MLQRDVLQQAVEQLREKYAGYKITSVKESWFHSQDDSLLQSGVWHGNYETFSPRWHFELRKLSGDYKGPDRLEIGMTPVFDIVFADIYPNVFFIEVGFHRHPEKEDRPTSFSIDGIEGCIWDIHYFYSVDLRDL